MKSVPFGAVLAAVADFPEETGVGCRRSRRRAALPASVVTNCDVSLSRLLFTS